MRKTIEKEFIKENLMESYYLLQEKISNNKKLTEKEMKEILNKIGYILQQCSK